MEWSAVATGAGVLTMVIINAIVIIRSRNRIIEERAEKRGATATEVKQFRNEIGHIQESLNEINNRVQEMQVTQASLFSTLTEQVRGHEVRITRLEEK